MADSSSSEEGLHGTRARSFAQRPEDELAKTIFGAVLLGWQAGEQAPGAHLASLTGQWETLDGGNGLKDMKAALITVL